MEHKYLYVLTAETVSQDIGLRVLHHSNDGEQYFALSNSPNPESPQSWIKAAIFEHQWQRFLIIRLLLPK